MKKYRLLSSLTFVFLWLGLSGQNSISYQVDYLSTEDGLSQNEVTSIIRDNYGFMWFGTRGGLNRFDGYQFKHFKPQTESTGASLHNPSIEQLSLTSNGDIWIGTKSGGLSVYDHEVEKFKQPDWSKSISHRIVSFYEDQSSQVWIGGWQGGLWQYNQVTDTVLHWLGNTRINTIIQTDDGTIWCGTNEGLFYFKDKNDFQKFDLVSGIGEITEIVLDEKNSCFWMVGWEMGLVRVNYTDYTFTRYNLPRSISNLPPLAYSLIQDHAGNIWVGTWGNGLFKFNIKDQNFNHFTFNQKNRIGSSTDYNVILDIYEDPGNDIWLGTEGGIIHLSGKSGFHTLNSNQEKEINDLHVTAVLADYKDNVWIGTKRAGLFITNTANEIKKVEFLPNNPLYKKEGLLVKKIYQDPGGNIWISFNDGLYIALKKDDGSYYMLNATVFFKSPDLAKINKAHDLIVKNDELWIATQQSGLFLYKWAKGEYVFVKNFISSTAPGQLPENRVTSLLFDNSDHLWLGTYKGLLRFEPTDSTFISTGQLIEDGLNALCDITFCTYLDKKNNIWFGTPCGLNKLSHENEKWVLTDYNKNDGISDDYINGILEDNNGDIWISTNVGISQLNIKEKNFRNYDVTDGIGGSNFSESACYKENDGTLYFGGFSGLTYFNPEEIKENTTNPPIVITSFKVLNRDVPISNNDILHKNINNQEKIVLTYREHEFSFEFAALDYKAPSRNQYAYRLEGTDEGIINIGTRRHISFSNLKPGNYNLHLYGTNGNGVWSTNEKTLEIKVRPAPWVTWYAIGLYVVVILSIIIIIININKKQVRLENKVQMEKVQREHEHQMSESKINFFTNISHEIRTPLTLILAPINELVKKDIGAVSPDYVTRKIKLVQSNARRLYNLINQLLEFRKIEEGKQRLRVAKHDIVKFVDEICFGFEELANARNVEFGKSFRIKEPLVYFDSEKMDVIINNMLSNAFNYAGKPGKVGLAISENDNEVIIRVTNNGIGIPEQELKYIFDPFYQVSGKHSVASSGIGLALVKSYINLHKGEISADSIPGEITTFTVSLKKGFQHFSPNELIQEEISSDHLTIPSDHLPKLVGRSVNTGTKGAKILIVENNGEVRNYLAELLGEEFEIIEAENGQNGYKNAIEHKPALIISDVMMPKMDGFELCEKIKSNDILSHIPIILLTAKGTSNDILYGTKKGADYYMPKPFDPELLKEKIKQLIANRKFLKKKFSKKVTLEPSQIEIDSSDSIFIEKTIAVIEKNIRNTHFDQNILAGEMAMSESTFYRKIKKSTQKTPGEFIKSIRLKRAAQLLKESNLTVSEILEEVGYMDIKHFRNNFKLAYNQTPSQYRSKIQNNQGTNDNEESQL